jgi:hypothetical protein
MEGSSGVKHGGSMGRISNRFVRVSRSMKSAIGSDSEYFPRPTLMASSQYTAGLISGLLPGSEIRDLAVWLSCGSSRTNHGKACVFSRSLMVCNLGSL